MKFGLRAVFVVFAILGSMSAGEAEGQVQCEFSLTTDRTYPILVTFSEKVTGLRRTEFSVSGGKLEELIPVDGTTTASRIFKLRPADLETARISRPKKRRRDRRRAKRPRTARATTAALRVSLPAGAVTGTVSKKQNVACGPIYYSDGQAIPTATPVQPTPPPATPTKAPPATATPTKAPPAPTSTPVPTATFTRTPVATSTPVPPAPTSTRTAAPTATQTATATNTPVRTATATPTRTATPVATVFPTWTPGSPMSCSETIETQPNVLAFPGAVGHGRFTVGGSGRHRSTPCANIYKVTTRADSGPGSLRECVEARGPRTCVFEVGGQFWATKELKVRYPFLTIAGQTAPAPGVNIRGSGLSIEASEVIVQHVRFRVGDDPRAACCKTSSCSASEALTCTADPGSRDGIRIYSSSGAINNVLVDHVSISWALDEGFSVAPTNGDITNVTFSNSIIGSGLDMSIHPEASSESDPGHSKGVLINGGKSLRNFSFIGNYLAHNAERNIRASTNLTMEFLNNLVYDWGRGRGAGRTIELTNSIRATHEIDVIGNLYLPGKDTFCPDTEYRPALCFENGADGVDSAAERLKMHSILRVGSGVSSGLSSASRYFLHDNIGPTRPNAGYDEWAAADKSFFSGSSLIYPANRASGRVASSSSYSPRAADDLLNYLPERVGARPYDRDSVDDRLLLDLYTADGRIINCVAPDGSARCAKNAGGWPSYPEVRRGFAVPRDYTGDSDLSGYTDLEDLLIRSGEELGG